MTTHYPTLDWQRQYEQRINFEYRADSTDYRVTLRQMNGTWEGTLWEVFIRFEGDESVHERVEALTVAEAQSRAEELLRADLDQRITAARLLLQKYTT